MLTGAISEGMHSGFMMGVWVGAARVFWIRSEERLVLQDTGLSLGRRSLANRRSQCSSCSRRPDAGACSGVQLQWRGLSVGVLLGAVVAGGLHYGETAASGKWIWELCLAHRWGLAAVVVAVRAALHALILAAATSTSLSPAAARSCSSSSSSSC